MLGKKKKTAESYDKKIQAVKFERVFQALKDILKTEIRTPTKDGKDEIDYAATCTAMKTKARIVLDFIADLEKDGEEN